MYRRRTGLSYIEVAVATVLIAALLAGVAQALSLVAQQRRASLYRMIATEEAANIVERVAAHSFDQLTREKVDAILLSPPTRSTLPAASLHIDLAPIDTTPRAKRVAVEIGWARPGGEKGKPIRVVAWKYEMSGDIP